MPSPNQTNSFTSAPLISFQLDKATILEKSDPKWGIKLAEDIQSKVYGGTSSYFWQRNSQWKVSRNYAHGMIPMQKFMDLLEFNGKVNYLNLSWQCIYIVNRIVSGLVGRWMSKSEKIYVKATDTLSVKEKQDQYEQLEFYIDNKEKLETLQKESGVQLLPPNDELPGDKEQLRLWQSQFQRTPEEILYELGINDVLSSNGWFDVLKEKMLHDSAETGFVGTYTWMDSDGVVHVEWLKPENCFYSSSDYPDFRDTSWRGYMRTRKISELRKMYGQEFNPNNPLALTEEQLFKMAQTAKDYQRFDNLSWIAEWNVTYLRPYDEWNVDVMEFELRTVDSEPYTQITTKKNKSTILKKGRPTKLGDNEVVIDDTKINIYRGVYARSTQTMLEWGLKKNMIRPQDPKEIGNAEFSYSFYMVQNYDMTTLSVPKKIQEPADQMIIARLKMQQLVAKMRPIGAAVNWDALQNIDYGLGDGNKAIDVKKLYDQTGDLYWRSRDAEGNPIPVPIQELQNSGFLNQLQGLILLYDKHYQIMKDELGEDPNLISQALQPRVTEGNVETSQAQAEFATDQFYRAYVECMKDTAKKVSCLLKDSVTYGADVYRKIVNIEDLPQRIFNTDIRLLPDQIQIARFEALMSKAMDTTPELSLFIDPFQMMRIAQEDVKLAETLFRQGTKKMLLWKQATAEQNQQATFKAQIESAKTTEAEKRQTEADKGQIDLAQKKIEGEWAAKNATIAMVTSLLSKGVPIPANLMPLVSATVENLILPLMVENEEQKTAIIQSMKAAQQQPAESQQQENISQPPPQEQQAAA